MSRASIHHNMVAYGECPRNTCHEATAKLDTETNQGTSLSSRLRKVCVHIVKLKRLCD